MYTTTPPPLQSVFGAALIEYKKQTGKDIVEHPLSTKLVNCKSVDDVLAVFQEQAQAFEHFRKGDWKVQLMRRLKPVVHVVLALSTGGVLGEGLGLVRRIILYYLGFSNGHPAGTSARKSNICWNGHPPHGLYLISFFHLYDYMRY